MISEVDLIKLCRKNDRKGQQQLFDLFKRKVMGICLRYASSRMEADDILQEAFIKIFHSLIRNETIEIVSLGAWIHRITTNTAITFYYKERNNNGVLQLDQVNEKNSVVSAESVLEALNEEELLSLIQEMPLGYRMVFNLAIIEGFDHREIGNKLGITESSSRSQLTRAKAWLKERITKKELLYG
ncbi:MAG: sigma-70 family RNA polymerase sigma factor [Cyclobacteriaceae bacterium]